MLRGDKQKHTNTNGRSPFAPQSPLYEDTETIQHLLSTPPPPPTQILHSPEALPGRPRRRQPPGSAKQHASPSLKKKKKKKHRGGHSNWIQSARLKLIIAVGLWYACGVVSIGTSKLLLSAERGGSKPLVLSVQQFGLGVLFLRLLLQWSGDGGEMKGFEWSFMGENRKNANMELLLCGLFFSLGFVATNYSFYGNHASFVETIKAAEPLTSAAVAVTWKVDTLGLPEGLSLLSIVGGVFLSTIGNTNAQAQRLKLSGTISHPLSSSIRTCLIVMFSNLCFSFRGLHQKLLRKSTKKEQLDDVNLQYRMQQIGAMVFLIPALLFEVPGLIKTFWHVHRYTDQGSGYLWNYVMLSLINGFAFASYNLASTYILTRISVVHHAALNCIRRVFAIIVTSIFFQVPFTFLGILGICLSIVGFLCFSHYKLKRQTEPRPLSSLLPMSVVE